VSDDRHAAARDEDWEALARAGRGDGDAFTMLVERHQERLLRLCARMLGNREEALDAAQEVFLKAYRHAAHAEPRGQFFTWLYRIGVNHCLNRLRRRKIVRFLSFGGGESEDEGPALDPPSPAPDPAAELEARERWARTRAAIDRLPESQRSVLILAKFEGLRQKQIAELLGITEGAVESRLVRALRTLAAAQEVPAPGVAERRARV